MTTDSELEGLQCAPFHVPPSLAHMHPSHLKAMQEEWPAWFPSGEADPYYDEDVTPYTPKPRTVDDVFMAALLRGATGQAWQVRMSRDAHSMSFLCKELSTGIKLRTPTLEPEMWAVEELKKQVDNIVWLYERELARRADG